MRSTNYRLGGRPRSSDDVRHVKAWIARHFDVGPQGFVSVMELKCAAAGCPPAQTVMLVFREDGATFEARVHAPLQEIAEADIAEAFRAPRRMDGPRG